MMNFHSKKSNTAHNRASTAKLVGLATLRFFQFASAVLVMSLIAYAIHAYGFHGSKKTNFVLAVGVIGTFYNLAVFVLAIAVPKLVFAGIYFFFEVVMCLLWFAAFIVDAKVQGDHSCKIKHTAQYNPKYGNLQSFTDSEGDFNAFTNKYTTKTEKTACQSAKASIAFAGLSWALFMISSVFVGLNILNPVIAHYGGKGMFKTGSSMGTRVDRASALTLVDPIEDKYAPEDVEAAAGVPNANVVHNEEDQHTLSTNNTAHDGQEKSETSEVSPTQSAAMTQAQIQAQAHARARAHSISLSRAQSREDA